MGKVVLLQPVSENTTPTKHYMKKIILSLAVLLSACMAQAADYPYLVFTNTGGTTTVLSVENLTLSVSGSTLQVTNADGTNSFTLTDLANMQFSKDGSTVSAIENVLQADKAVEVFTVSGVRLGTYSSLAEGIKSLNAGAYIIKQNTNAQTIVVR